MNHKSQIGITHNEATKLSTAQLPVLTNAILTVLKLGVVVLTGSVSVLAEAVNSAGDLFASSVSYATVRAADTPPDDTHTYGHGKFENLSGALIAVIIIGGALYALNEAVHRFVQRDVVTHTLPAIGVMAFSTLVNLFISRRLLDVGRRCDSPALAADGIHLRTDIMTSLAVLIGLLLTRLTHAYWIDPAVAVCVTVLVFWVGLKIALDAAKSLSDFALPPQEEEILRKALASDPRILGFHKLRTRKAGSHRHIDVHVLIDDQHSFVEAHQLTEEFEDMLRRTLPNLHPIIHIEPYEAEMHHQMEEQATLPDSDEW